MKPSWIACWVTEKAPEITAWLAMIVAAVASSTSGSRSASGRKVEERVLDLGERLVRRGRQDHRALPHVVEQQRGQHEIEPRDADRLAPEMAHVGVERLGPGHGENHRAHGDERAHEIGREEVTGVERVEHRQ